MSSFLVSCRGTDRWFLVRVICVKKMLYPVYGERKEKKRERKENFGFLDPSKGLVLFFWETVDGGLEHF